MLSVLAAERIDHMSQLDREDFEYFRSAVRALAGITLSDSKHELVKSRLRSRIHALGLKGFSEYRALLQTLPAENIEWQEFINHLTTNKTDWFRESSHFEHLVNEFLPELASKGNWNKLRVWSAACSTGEEPYTISMVLDGLFGAQSNKSYEILATDIDSKVLSRAKRGIYAKVALEQIPDPYRRTAFVPGTEAIAHLMKIQDRLKNKVSFRQLNLTQTPYPYRAEFDVIFCRNVFIYFSKDVITQIADALYQAAAPGAILFIGHSESLQSKSKWQYVSPSIFRKRSAT